MTLRELMQLVALGENQHLEFKRRVPRGERIAKEIIAFANSKGGRLLLGVDDDGTVVGVRDAEEEEFALRQALAVYCQPAIDVSMDRVPVTDKRDVIVVSVPPSSERPHYLVTETDAGRTAYVRVEDMSVEASPEAVHLMRASRSTEDVLFEFGEKEQMLMRYLDNYGRISVEQFASIADISLHLASRTLILLTRANVLRLHSDPRQDYFTLAYDLSD